jgi:hypothetical protein
VSDATSPYETLRADLGYVGPGRAAECFAALAEAAKAEDWGYVGYLARVMAEQGYARGGGEDTCRPARHRGTGGPVVRVEADDELVLGVSRLVGQPSTGAVGIAVVNAAGVAGPVQATHHHRLGCTSRSHRIEQF